MGLFSKAEIVETTLNFKIQELQSFIDEEDERFEEGGEITFEAYGRVGEEIENKYYHAIVLCEDIVYDEFAQTLINMSDKNLKIIAKVKNGKVKSFKIDFKDLARKLNDVRYEKLFMLDAGVSKDKSWLD